jgi:hypothetical protein
MSQVRALKPSAKADHLLAPQQRMTVTTLRSDFDCLYTTITRHY